MDKRYRCTISKHRRNTRATFEEGLLYLEVYTTVIKK